MTVRPISFRPMDSRSSEDTASRATLEQCIHRGDRMGLDRALRSGIDPNAHDPLVDGSALMTACLLDEVDMVRSLLDFGADPNHTTARWGTVLTWAAGEGRVALVRLLLEGGATIPSAPPPVCGKDVTPLWIAADRGRTDVVDLLLAAGAADAWCNAPRATDGRTPLMQAAANKHSEVLRRLLACGADPNVADKNGQTALLHAVAANHPAAVADLLRAGARIDVVAALVQAVEHGNDLVALILFERGGVVLDNDFCPRLLDKAIAHNCPGVVHALVRLGVPINVHPDSNHRTPLIGAVASGHERIVRLLLRLGADPNIRNRHGEWPLYTAAMALDPALVGALLEAGADPAACDGHGRTLLDVFMAVDLEYKLTPSEQEIPNKLRAALASRDRQRLHSAVQSPSQTPPSDRPERTARVM